MPTFVLIETLGTQDYIFRSNRLPENIGASELVRRATTTWVWDAVHGNTVAERDYDAQPKLTAGAAAEIITTAGGNAFLVCATDEVANEIVWAVTRRALQEAPGLHLNAAICKPAQVGDSIQLAEVRNHLTAALKTNRAQALATASLGGLAVTAPCVSTGQPASAWWVGEGNEPERRRVSAEVVAKMCAARDRKNTPNASLCSGSGATATKRLRGEFQATMEGLRRDERLGEKVDFSDQLDDLGRADGEASYLAIVHADGNGIGQFFQNARLVVDGEPNGLDDQIARSQRFSKMSDEAAMEALKEAVQQVADAIAMVDGKPTIVAPDGSSVPNLELARAMKKQKDGSYKRTGSYIFPVRPIVFGGDDVTVVCDGRIGLAFAEAYIKAFEKHAEKKLTKVARTHDPNARVTASAGVAIVKAHYPFAQAYALAESLTSHAKKEGTRKPNGLGAMDWHVAEAAVYTDDVERLREREYKVTEGWATMRPVVVTAHDPGTIRSWETVKKGIEGFRAADWAERRSKIKELADVIRNGPQATATYLERLGAARKDKAGPVELPDLGYSEQAPSGASLPRDAAERAEAGEQLRQARAAHENGAAELRRTGWQGGQSLYADAVSLHDVYLSLTPAADASSSASD